MKLEKRLWQHVDRTTGPDGCWEWTGLRNPKGYGRMGWQGHMRLTHRLAWEVVNGEIVDGLCILHRCDNPPCCNPAHLFIGTGADNAADRDRKGRGGTARGERSNTAKLNADQVRAIRSAHGSNTAIAAAFGVHAVTVGMIRRNKTWRHIT